MGFGFYPIAKFPSKPLAQRNFEIFIKTTIKKGLRIKFSGLF
ncbi:hypothetical protein P872_06565 [Rhodonellum psychrophilum GCM71 = DSM 17998]|uniref:Uncharacterized protein n=1 Tax=Rhodonellum psychrophilum GCM71 = DSM 17998 TaxID=1123057 RepID=U5BQ22_9BACT|nr:hypothetical protein P872_06565 [Rhodonellum psychrophilum GCM71 = DSM 17998]